VDWLCFPRFDSPSVFGRLLDDEAGHWSIRPAGEYTNSRRYVDRTLVLETAFRTATGALRLTDGLAMGAENRGHALGRGAPHLLIRSLTCVAGDVEVDVSYQPRPEYGLLRPLLSHVDGGVTARGGAEWLTEEAFCPLCRFVGREIHCPAGSPSSDASDPGGLPRPVRRPRSTTSPTPRQ
jgi:GH15 family glucan-1,4-alpha-glucosidase